MSTDAVYYDLIKKITFGGNMEVCRKFTCKELILNTTVVNMKSPLVTLEARNLGYKFALAEAAWILSGDNRVDTIKPFSKMIEKFSDDGVTFFGAYGPPIADQLEYIGRAFKNDLFTRQAMMTIWRQKPPVTNDIPCTISIQFLIRKNMYGILTLHMIDTMRSSDSWLGVPYDWFSFSMLGAYVAIYLKNILGIELELGNLYMVAGSQHLYTSAFGYNQMTINNFLEAGCYQSHFEYAPINIDEFSKPSELISHLWTIANYPISLPLGKRPTIASSWMYELILHWIDKEKNNETK